MTISDIAQQKGVKELIHFTTNSGLLGILAKGGVLPNAHLTKEDTLAFIFKQNSASRKERDKRWLNYINLSISKVNNSFFSYSQYIHKDSDVCWIILSFSTDTLNQEGVYFTTTNNIFPSCKRGEGEAAFINMFAPSIEGKFQKKFCRTTQHMPSWTTCEEAEVLFPEFLTLDYLQKIYVPNLDVKRIVIAQLSAFNSIYEICVAPEKFK